MIETFFGIVVTVFKAVTVAISALIEIIGSFFVASDQSLSVSETVIAIFAFITEMILWFLLWLRELVIALLQRRKPRYIVRLKLYKRESSQDTDNEEQ